MLFDSNDFIAPPALLSSSLLHTIPWVVPGLPQSPSWLASFPSALIPWPISQFESLLSPLRWLSDFCLWFRLTCYSQIDFRSLNRHGHNRRGHWEMMILHLRKSNTFRYTRVRYHRRVPIFLAEYSQGLWPAKTSTRLSFRSWIANSSPGIAELKCLWTTDGIRP
jgi:hypothetical protein